MELSRLHKLETTTGSDQKLSHLIQFPVNLYLRNRATSEIVFISFLRK